MENTGDSPRREVSDLTTNRIEFERKQKLCQLVSNHLLQVTTHQSIRTFFSISGLPRFVITFKRNREKSVHMKKLNKSDQVKQNVFFRPQLICLTPASELLLSRKPEFGLASNYVKDIFGASLIWRYFREPQHVRNFTHQSIINKYSKPEIR